MARARARADDLVTRYAQEVVDGKIPACLTIRQACERHLRDLKMARTRGLRWDPDAAQHAIDFFGFLRHSKGEWAGTRFDLEHWQQFIVGSIFGWKRKDGLRRFRTAYIEIPRKNGKSTLAAGIGLYLLVADGEPGAEIYSAATKRDQAKIVWGEGARMVKRSPALSGRVQALKTAITVEQEASTWLPLGADEDTLDGLNIHGAIIDELHAHKGRGVWDVLDTATGSRRQPLIFAITTAGTDRQSVCYEQHEYALGLLKGTIRDDSYFVFVATLDEGARWDDPAEWQKVNPNWGISVKPDDMERLAAQAKHMPGKLNAFLRLRLNVWTQQVDRWINLDLWDEQGRIVKEEQLKGRLCYGGLDLSSVTDTTAWVLVFPYEDDPEEIDVLARIWVPEARLDDERNRYRDQYHQWARAGFLRTVPGDAIDYSFIKAQVLRDAETFRLVDLNVDRLFQGHQLSVELAEELGEERVVGMGQGFLSMAAPMQEFERRLLTKKVHHGGHPVLRWMADNVAVKQDPAGNLKPDKASSQGRIDGIVALVMALDRAMRHEAPKTSVYEERGRIFL